MVILVGQQPPVTKRLSISRGRRTEPARQRYVSYPGTRFLLSA
jgi:hypothetical protein